MKISTPQDRMIGESICFLEMQEHVSRLAPLNKPVLIIGERGTGKELIASRLHYLSKRWQQSFLKVNCASVTESLLDSQLFGHESGAFTGATARHKGYFERADQGSLFLDELATTTMRVQEKILRAIEYGEIERLGSNQTLQIDTRIIAATNADLPAMARNGEFREDLLDRLAFDVITLPPLRERTEDILLLAQHFAVNMVKELDRDYFPGFTGNAEQALRQYAWPGNIRELKNVVERAVYQSKTPDQPVDTVVFDPFASPYRLSQPARETSPDPDHTPNENKQQSSGDPMPTAFKQQVKHYEIELLSQALRDCQYNQRKTADHLELTYDQLRGYLRKYNLLPNQSG